MAAAGGKDQGTGHGEYVAFVVHAAFPTGAPLQGRNDSLSVSRAKEPG
jgi:hypothetical protein